MTIETKLRIGLYVVSALVATALAVHFGHVSVSNTLLEGISGGPGSS